MNSVPLLVVTTGALSFVFAWNIFLFARAIRTAFSRPNGMPICMRLLAIFAALAACVDTWAILTKSNVSYTRFATALLLLAFSQALFRSAIAATRRQRLSLAFSNDTPDHLTNDGPYRLVRHPFYLAYILTWAAAAVATQHPVCLAALGLLTLTYSIAAQQEEGKFLHSPLASASRAYQTTTGMFIPRFGLFAHSTPYGNRH